MVLGGMAVALRNSGALWIEDGRMLVVADLHLEKGSAYASRGQLLPPWDTRETLRRLTAEVEATDPAVVVLLAGLAPGWNRVTAKPRQVLTRPIRDSNPCHNDSPTPSRNDDEAKPNRPSLIDVKLAELRNAHNARRRERP